MCVCVSHPVDLFVFQFSCVLPTTLTFDCPTTKDKSSIKVLILLILRHLVVTGGNDTLTSRGQRNTRGGNTKEEEEQVTIFSIMTVKRNTLLPLHNRRSSCQIHIHIFGRNRTTEEEI